MTKLVMGKDRYGKPIDHEDEEVCDALEHMRGSTIEDLGFIKDEKEGGLGFDYIKEGKKYRLVLGYNELGEWVKSQTIYP